MRVARLTRCDKCGLVADNQGACVPRDWKQINIDAEGGRYNSYGINLDLCPDCLKAMGWINEKQDYTPPTAAERLYDAIVEIAQEGAGRD
jgi:hypothetical protein